MLELFLFLLRELMFLLTAAVFFYLEPGFGVGGRSFGASSSPTAFDALQPKILVWVPVAKCETAQKWLAGLQKKKYRKGLKHFLN